jgi:hypothetical protein
VKALLIPYRKPDYPNVLTAPFAAKSTPELTDRLSIAIYTGYSAKRLTGTAQIAYSAIKASRGSKPKNHQY